MLLEFQEQYEEQALQELVSALTTSRASPLWTYIDSC